jgi:hypothetical protein
MAQNTQINVPLIDKDYTCYWPAKYLATTLNNKIKRKQNRPFLILVGVKYYTIMTKMTNANPKIITIVLITTTNHSHTLTGKREGVKKI